MIDTIFRIFGLLMIYIFGVWSGIGIAALIVACRDREAIGDERKEITETRSRDSEPKE